MAVEALDLVNIKPEESFESYYNERLTFVTNEYSEGRKKEMFNDAYVYILDIEDGIKVNDENIPEIEKEKINSKFSQNELLFIGFMLDMFYDVVTAASLVASERMRSTMALSSVETGAPNSPAFVLIFVIFIVIVFSILSACKDTKIK